MEMCLKYMMIQASQRRAKRYEDQFYTRYVANKVKNRVEEAIDDMFRLDNVDYIGHIDDIDDIDDIDNERNDYPWR